VSLWAGKPSRYVASHLGQLSLPSLQVGKLSTSLSGWDLGGVRSFMSGWQVTLITYMAGDWIGLTSVLRPANTV